MAVRFILGRSGAGKTRHCVAQVRRRLADAPEGPPLVLLVPEQATFQIERALIEPDGEAVGGFARARVLSFRRFAHLLFNELGGPAFPPISALARQMALRAVLEPIRDRLTTFAASLDRPGFLARLADVFREFHQYQVTSARLRERAAVEPRERLARKLAELADAFDAFNDYLARARLTDPDAALTVAADLVGRSALARGAAVWIDGFAGFTPQELRFVGELARAAESVEIALVLDPADHSGVAPADGLFRRTQQTRQRLVSLFADKGVRVGRPVMLDRVRRFAPGGVLERIERDLFASVSLPGAPVPPKARDPLASSPLLTRRDDALLLVEAPDRRAEVRAAAAHVRHLVAAHHYCYRDIAVILRDLDEYWPFIVEAFDEAGIPYFIDRRRPVSHHPLVELLRSAVATVARRLAAADVIAYLKTDLVGLSAGGEADVRDAADRLENYALAYGLAGEAWFDPDSWRFHETTAFGDEDLAGSRPPPPPHIEPMKAVARAAMAPLAELHAQAAAAGGRLAAEAWAAALWRLMTRLDVRGTLARWADEPRGRGDDAQVHGRVFELVGELLGDLAVALRGTPMDAAEFAAVLGPGLSQLTLGLVPPAIDQVLVGAIERSRHPHLRAALVLGLAERSFPRPAAVGTVLTDDEREALAGSAGALARGSRLNDVVQSEIQNPKSKIPIELAPGRVELLFDEDLMAYLAVTRPAERLWVSYPLADDAGKPVAPSRYFTRLRALVPESPLIRLADEHPALAALTGGELAGVLAAGFASPSEPADSALAPPPLERSLYGVLRKTDPAALAVACSALDYANAPALSAATARKLFAPRGRLTGSVSRLESFAACPFQHLANYGLKLKVRERIELDALQLGRFYHEMLRQLFERLAGDAGFVRWSDHSPEALAKLIGELVSSARERFDLPRLASGPAAYLLARAEGVLAELAAAFHHASAAQPHLRQASAELIFGFGDDATSPPLEIELEGQGGRRLALGGRIDRVDLADDGALFVIDYKTAGHRLNWAALYHGLSLQLPGYLLALNGGDGARPAGAFFQRIEPETRPGQPPPPDAAPPSERERLAAFRRAGLFEAESARLLDERLEPGESSPFVNLRLKQDGTPWANSDAVSRRQLEALLAWSADRMRQLGESILAGESAVAPYRMGGERPCTGCAFRAVCRLDFDYNRPRHLARLDAKEAAARMQEEAP